MNRKVKGLSLVVIFVVYLTALCVAGESDFLKPGEISSAENHCKFFLRTLGTSQQAYMETNSNGNYGNWWSLQRSGYIEEGYNRSDFIENYSISVFNVRNSTMMGGRSAHDSSFTIVAVPNKHKNQLRTFAIGNNNSPVVWIGNRFEWNYNSSLGLKNRRHWA